MKKTMILLMNFWFQTPALKACPFCASNLQQNSQGFSLGITASIFLLLGAVGGLTGFIVYQIIRQDKKRKA